MGGRHYWGLFEGIMGSWIYYLMVELHESDGDPSQPYSDLNENKSLFDRDFKDDRSERNVISNTKS